MIHHYRLRKAFTLAEVLITLGIIGIVAAMTMPTLVANTKKREYSVRLSKFYNVMQQAILMYNNKNNTLPEDWGYPQDTSDDIYDYWQLHFAPNLQNVINVEKTRNQFTNWRNGIVVYFNDGSKLSMTKGGVIDIKYDVNGDKLPNEFGRDQYVFLLQNVNFNAYNWRGDINNIKPPEGEDNYTTDMNDRNNLLRLCKRDRTFCSRLLQLDNWEYQSDYPHRL